mmetsp:Transcript_21121/g.34961  ORF Transcript_21121/g.34961 Transcript_21121/m.34961 type:complete len:274 (-) Transcript_21121:671-1492(-)
MGSALHLQFSNHDLLGIVASRSLVEKTLRQVVTVNISKEILVGKVRKQLYNSVERLLNFCFTQFLSATLEDTVTIGRHEFCVGMRSNILVDNLNERILERLLEEGMTRKVLLDNSKVLFVQINECLDKLWIIWLILFSAIQSCLSSVDDIQTHSGDEIFNNASHWIQTILQTREQTKHSLQIFRLVVRQQDTATRSFLLKEYRLDLLQDFFFDNLQKLGLRRLVEVIRDAVAFLIESSLSLDKIIRCRVGSNPILTFLGIVFTCRFQQGVFQV